MKSTHTIPAVRWHSWRLLQGVVAYFAAPIRSDLVVSHNINPLFFQVREQILTVLLRSGTALGSGLLAISIPAMLARGQLRIALVNSTLLLIAWGAAIVRQLDYRIRSRVMLLVVYSAGVIELSFYGYTSLSHFYLIAFSLFTPLFISFNSWVGTGALALSTATLALAGWLIHSGAFVPLANPRYSLSSVAVIANCSIFGLVLICNHIGLMALLRHVQALWQHERDARLRLEQCVAERTAELEHTHAAVAAASRRETEQKEYLAALHQATFDLLNHRDMVDLLQVIVERAALILNAPYISLALADAGELVVRALTPGQARHMGQCLPRSSSASIWQAYDTRQPAIDAYTHARELGGQHYDYPAPYPAADIPIVIEQRCLGVLSLGRAQGYQQFTDDDIQKALMFAQLVALVLDNANLYATALREIAERGQTEQTLKSYARELQEQNVELSAFAHTVAHDLKNPLTSLIGYSDLLESSYAQLGQAEIEDFLHNIGRMGRKMTRITDDLLMLASVRAQSSVPVSTLNMEEIILDTELQLQAMITSARATLILPEHWPAAQGYAPWVEAVWTNYISNAVKYGGDPPQVTLGASPTADGMICFWAHDNGPGLGEGERAQLFVPFRRLHTHRVEGHGLGLSIVQRIINTLGGTVGVESTPGQGSRFYFTLPAAPAERP
ncbi:MAG: GAF domain-containing sensor histidine kinase [Kouleothrix sp.]|nr:GAF domain-containing sensor histidine kinase [Kouleothrix sp.]